MSSRRHRIYPLLLERARAFRRSQTPAETKLWARLRKRQLGGYKFRRQHIIGRFVVDFCCVATHLVIEVDGASHANDVAYDQARTAWLEDRGYHVVRFTNHEVLQRTEDVLASILTECQERQRGHPA